ncbi:hemoglobin subunit beta-2-like [Thunnus maccoyii]|uniref:hemoglobin subunit beta-2-like n=1 Tax=Thunnus maccoyii TaxID=8240 RepID=UPI001C4D3096|nr:hemoglobin subunit beta-2-like [Thunnus maccoyii]
MSKPMIANHGKTILRGLDQAVKTMDNIKATYAELSVLHSEKLHVDPDNFKKQPKSWRYPYHCCNAALGWATAFQSHASGRGVGLL